jgi:hypothetical protein
MTAPQLTLPPGDPAGLAAAATALDRVAAGLDDQRGRFAQHNLRLREVWLSDSASPAALLGAGTLQTAAQDSGQAVQKAAGAVRSYSRALASGQQELRTLQLAQQLAGHHHAVDLVGARAVAAEGLDGVGGNEPPPTDRNVSDPD